MTTLTSCRRAAKGLAHLVIVHTPGHVDDTKKATDRGYTVIPMNEVWNFGAEIDAVYNALGQPLILDLVKSFRGL
jgi:hypothetical protein